MDLKEIKALIDLMKKNDLSEFELEKADTKIRIKRDFGKPIQVTGVNSPVPTAILADPVVSISETARNIESINSPMVGTFYVASSPDAEPFVQVGQEVQEDTVVCIIEAMKVMNEIKAEMKGRIKRVLAENGKSVEFGAPLFEIEPL